ncbi:VanZ family protein [Sporosarcina sp. CAU 1771]
MKKIIVLLALLFILFISSGQTYEQQSIIPTLEKWLPGKPFESILSKLAIPYWGIEVSIDERGYYYFIEFIIRKSAHFIIFGLVALSVYFVLPKYNYRTLLALLLTIGLACLDEFHQSLTGGRTPSMQDVLLDTAGAVTALFLVRIILILRNRKKH